MDNIIKEIVNKRLLDLLTTIHKHYPDKFTKEAIQIELQYIASQLEYNIIPKSNPNSNPPSKINLTGKITGNTKIKNNKNTENITIRARNINPEVRCCARIWGDIIIRETGIKVDKIDPKFKITDFQDIKTKSFNNMYILGKQCNRKRNLINKTDKYCNQHSQHNPHGNWFESPNQEIIFHYLKEGKYI